MIQYSTNRKKRMWKFGNEELVLKPCENLKVIGITHRPQNCHVCSILDIMAYIWLSQNPRAYTFPLMAYLCKPFFEVVHVMEILVNNINWPSLLVMWCTPFSETTQERTVHLAETLLLLPYWEEINILSNIMNTQLRLGFRINLSLCCMYILNTLIKLL